MKLQDLQAFVAVAETGSISRAAARLNLTQPATTRRVQNFEAAAGGSLLDRTVKPFKLTPAGRQMVERSHEVLRAIAALEASVREQSEPCGELRIGVGMGAEWVLGKPLDELRRRFPNLQLRIGANWTAIQIEALRTGAIDLAVAFVTKHHTVPSNITMSAIALERIAVVVSRETKLPAMRGRQLNLSDLADHSWVLNPVGCAYRLAVQQAYDAAGVPLSLAAEVTGREMQLSLVARGVGFGLVSQRALKTSAFRRALRVVRLSDFELAATLVVLRGAALGNLKPAVDLLQTQLAQQLRNQ